VVVQRGVIKEKKTAGERGRKRAAVPHSTRRLSEGDAVVLFLFLIGSQTPLIPAGKQSPRGGDAVCLMSKNPPHRGRGGTAVQGEKEGRREKERKWRNGLSAPARGGENFRERRKENLLRALEIDSLFQSC